MEIRTQDEASRAQLLNGDEGYRQLAEQHAQLERQIAAIEAKPHVTAGDELEEHRLKKLKLALKDQMTHIEVRHRHHAAS